MIFSNMPLFFMAGSWQAIVKKAFRGCDSSMKVSVPDKRPNGHYSAGSGGQTWHLFSSDALQNKADRCMAWASEDIGSATGRSYGSSTKPALYR
jgi:hypothetical protein